MSGNKLGLDYNSSSSSDSPSVVPADSAFITIDKVPYSKDKFHESYNLLNLPLPCRHLCNPHERIIHDAIEVKNQSYFDVYLGKDAKGNSIRAPADPATPEQYMRALAASQAFFENGMPPFTLRQSEDKHFETIPNVGKFAPIRGMVFPFEPRHHCVIGPDDVPTGDFASASHSASFISNGYELLSSVYLGIDSNERHICSYPISLARGLAYPQRYGYSSPADVKVNCVVFNFQFGGVLRWVLQLIKDPTEVLIAMFRECLPPGCLGNVPRAYLYTGLGMVLRPSRHDGVPIVAPDDNIELDHLEDMYQRHLRKAWRINVSGRIDHSVAAVWPHYARLNDRTQDASLREAFREWVDWDHRMADWRTEPAGDPPRCPPIALDPATEPRFIRCVTLDGELTVTITDPWEFESPTSSSRDEPLRRWAPPKFVTLFEGWKYTYKLPHHLGGNRSQYSLNSS